MAYYRPIRLDELIDWFVDNGLELDEAEPLATKLYNYCDEIIIASNTAQ